MMKILTGLLMATLCASGFAAPGTINYSGRLVDNLGAPVTAATAASFSFYDAATNGSRLGGGYGYDTTVTPNADGLYSVSIGDVATGTGGPVPAAIFDASAVWLNVNMGGEDLAPRARISTVGYAFRADESTTSAAALRALGLSGSAFVTASSTGTAIQNGQALLAAYQQAKVLRPNQQDLAATNRAVVLVPPGRYDLSVGSLTLDTEFVDIIGLSPSRENQWIFGESNGSGTGVLMQTTNDVHIENLVLECTRNTGSLSHNANDPAAYFPDTFTANTVLANCAFMANDSNAWSMRISIGYAGHYTGCTGGAGAFGGRGIASGIFTNCTGGYDAFGGGGTASGTFTGCTGGHDAFGGDGGTASGGRFKYCEGGLDSFGPGATTLYCIKDGSVYP